ncbi:hypothetical protein ACLOJK_041427 [Asimina triloba]
MENCSLMILETALLNCYMWNQPFLSGKKPKQQHALGNSHCEYKLIIPSQFPLVNCSTASASPAKNDAFAFLKGGGDSDYVTYSGFFQAVHQAEQQTHSMNAGNALDSMMQFSLLALPKQAANGEGTSQLGPADGTTVTKGHDEAAGEGWTDMYADILQTAGRDNAGKVMQPTQVEVVQVIGDPEIRHAPQAFGQKELEAADPSHTLATAAQPYEAEAVIA